MGYRRLKRQLDNDGYILLPGFVSGQNLDMLQSKIDHFIRVVVPTMPGDHVFYEDKQRPETLKQLQSLHRYEEYFAQLFLAGRFPALAMGLLGEEAIPSNIQYFTKPSSGSQPTPPHQDGYYFKLNPCRALTLWLALDKVDEENGCMRYVRGSHLRGMRPHGRTQMLGFSQGITDFPRPEDVSDERPVVVHPGDVIVHHALTIHRADANRSTGTRRALGLIYYAASAREDAQVKKAYESELFQELKTAGRI